jgi:DNA-binding NarL/FixJ family response regulator
MKGTVLLVEDEADTREMLARALERADYRCVAAQGAKDALASAAVAGGVDVVVTDVVMDRCDRRGLALMNELRAIGVHAPIIIITAYADVEKVKIALNQGAIHLLEKPFRASELIEVVDRVRTHGGQVENAIDRALSTGALTEKERLVARHLLDGKTSAEIADIEHNSPKTIRQHVSQIYAKWGARNRAEFVRLVYLSAEKRHQGGRAR